MKARISKNPPNTGRKKSGSLKPGDITCDYMQDYPDEENLYEKLFPKTDNDGSNEKDDRKISEKDIEDFVEDLKTFIESQREPEDENKCGDFYRRTLYDIKASFLMDEGFKESKLFRKYCTRFKKRMDDCIKSIRFGIRDYRGTYDFTAFMKKVVASYYISRYDKTHGVSSFNESSIMEGRLIVSFESETAASPWNIEKDYHSDAVDYNHTHLNTILDFVFEYTMGLRNISNRTKLTFNELCDKAICDVMYELIGYSSLYATEEVTKEDYLSKFPPEEISEQDIFTLSGRIFDKIVAEIDCMIYDRLLITNPDKFFTQLNTGDSAAYGKKKKQSSYLARKEDFNKSVKAYEKQINKYESEIAGLKKALEEKERETKKLRAEMNKNHTAERKAEQSKASSEMKSVKAEYEKEKTKNRELEEKNRKLEEFIALLQTDDEEIDGSDVSEVEAMAEPFRNARIVFVRNNKSTHYIIMKQLEDFFPNAKFTNGVDKYIDKNKTDIVVLLTKYVEHGTYWGARDESRNAGVECIHAEGSSLKKIVRLMNEALSKKQSITN